MDTTDGLTRDAAICFISDSLRIGSVDEVNNLLETERLTLLNRVIRSCQHYLAFQNLSLLSTDEQVRHVPTPSEVLQSGLSLQGGVCFHINVFIHYLLQALGYDSYLIAGTYSASKSQNNHVAVVVKGLDCCNSGESLHLVDIGCGYPTFEAVPLHRLPQIYIQAGLEYKIESLDGHFVRLHRKGDAYSDKEVPIMIGEWRKVFHFDPTPKQYEFFPPFMRGVFVEKENNSFLKGFRLVRFPMTGDATLVAVLGDQLLTVSSNGEKRSQAIDDKLEVVRKFFPDIPPDHIQKAITALNADSGPV